MEVNTRIQVEHRVTELCYSLKFTNPKDPKDSFVVESLVEAMALLARHKERLPKPTRVPRFGASAEARLNATDASLSPHAGGIIRFWSKPIEGEIRDDQGISLVNPDTGMFMRYRVAGAYDSNIALLLTEGEDRLESYQQLSKVLAPHQPARRRTSPPTSSSTTAWSTGSSARTSWPSPPPASSSPT